ncbi:hypothetical protein [Actinotalea subterranea]|uniref:hypothetical protein n=1 Tax=Actinotalea subterranea TaxID=2607497 RepID=UPI0011EF57A8|nr:hypothetical protein [Actinotalea subterranea]
MTLAPDPARDRGRGATAAGRGMTMEEDVGGQVTLTMEVVEKRLDNIQALLTELDEITTQIQGIQAKQTSERWASLPGAGTFASAYATTLGDLGGCLSKLRMYTEGLATTLAQNAADLLATDADAKARMDAILTKLDGGATTPSPTPAAPVTSAPPVAASAPAPTSWGDSAATS